MGENPDISKLLRMKRYEQPPPGYFEDFVQEFHRRQRAELLRRPTWKIVWDRISAIAPGFRVPQYAYATIAALAVCASVVIMSPRSVSPTNTLAKADTGAPAISLTSRPVTIGDTLPVSARADGSLPPHYVLQARPVSNEQPLSF